MLVKTVFLALLLSSVLYATTLKIAVAANMGDAIVEIVDAFEKAHANTTIKVIVGSSGKLATQIRFGAPYGLFLSANMQYPKKLHKMKRTLNTPVVYAQGTLALLTFKKSININEGLKVLSSSSIRKIAVANPKTAPYGVATIQALKKVKQYTKNRSKLVYAESIAQTLAYTKLATQVGIVAKSTLFSPHLKHLKEHVHWVDIDSSLYTPIEQGMVLLLKSKKEPLYQELFTFIQSSKAQGILQKYGYKI